MAWHVGENGHPPCRPSVSPLLWESASSFCEENGIGRVHWEAFLVQSKWAIRRCHQFQCMPVATETEVERLFSRILLNI